jgi:hypothetical protein
MFDFKQGLYKLDSARMFDLKGVPLDQYFSIIVDKINNADLPNWLKTQITSSIRPITYNEKTVLRIEVLCGIEPVWYDGNVYYRKGNSNDYYEKERVASIYRLF